MKKVVSITEADLKRIVKKVLKEHNGNVSEQLRKTGTKTIPILKAKTKEKKV